MEESTLPARFLRRFRSRLRDSYDDFLLVFAPAAESSLPLARFVYELKGKIKWIEEDGVNKPVAKWKAFEPPKNMKLSTMHTTGLSRSESWNIDPGREASNGSTEKAVAVAHFKAGNALDLKLEVLIDNRPHRHVTIRGWPFSPDKRHELIMFATRLAENATVDLR